MQYLQGNLQGSSTVLLAYKIQPRDLLSVNIITPKTITGTSVSVQTQGGVPMNQGAIFLTSYSVNDSGYITLPTIGKIKVSGQTTDEIEASIIDKMKVYLTEFSVIVKLANYHVSVQGEVKKPSMYYFYETKVTLLQAISMAGGFDDYANLSKIKIIRNTMGEQTSFMLDIHDINVVNKEGFMLMPGDTIYVEPLRAKAGNINRSIIAIVLSALSVAVTVYSVATR